MRPATKKALLILVLCTSALLPATFAKAEDLPVIPIPAPTSQSSPVTDLLQAFAGLVYSLAQVSF